MKERSIRKSFVLGVVLTVVLALGVVDCMFTTQDASAIPAFSRKYQTSCMTCHIGFPKINAFGTAFKNNGYRLPEEETFIKEEPIELGSESYERVWPNAVWPSTIAGTAPIALRVISQLIVDPTQSNGEPGRTGKIDFEFPHEIELLALGTIGKNLSYHLGIALQDVDARTAIEASWLEYNDILQGKFGINEDLFNVRVGFFPPMSTPFSQATERLTASRPALTNFKISGSKQPRMRDGQAGFEFYGMPIPRVRYVAGVVNGNAISTASEGFYDNNTEKDFYGRLEYKFGGLPFSGAAETGSDLSGGMTYFDQGTSVTVGTTGYVGVNQINDANNSSYHRITGFVRGSYDRYNLDLVYMFQQDDNAAGQVNSTNDTKIDTNGFYAEGTAFINPWISILARYDYLDTDHVTTLGASNPSDNTSRITLATPMYVRPNVRLVPEVSIGTSDTDDGNSKDSYQIRLDYAF